MGNVQCYSPNDWFDEDDAAFLLSVKSATMTDEDENNNNNNTNVNGGSKGVTATTTATNDASQQQQQPLQQVASNSSTNIEWKTRTEKSFLCTIHKDDRPHKVLLDTNEVTKALVEQAEELVRRERAICNSSSSNNSITDNTSGSGSGSTEQQDEGRLHHFQPQVDEHHDHDDLAAAAAAAGTDVGTAIPLSTVNTSVSAATQLAKNLSKSNISGRLLQQQREEEEGSKSTEQQQQQRKPQPPTLKGGKEILEESQNLRDEVHSVLSVSTRRNLGYEQRGSSSRNSGGIGSNKGSTTKTRSNNDKHTKDMRRMLHYDQLCGSLTCLVEDKYDQSYMRKVREHMSVLYLKMEPQCAKYYQNHLSQLMPEKSMMFFATAPSQNLPSRNNNNNNNNRPRPPRNSRVLPPVDMSSLPELTLSTDTSSSSNTNDEQIDFGVGPPSRPVRMLHHDVSSSPSFMDLAITGSLGLVDRGDEKNRSVVGQHNSKRFNKKSPPERFVVLLNRRSGIPLAVCALNSMATGPPTVRIYATKRRVYGQVPSSTTKKLGLSWSEPLPLYSWAEIVSEGRYPDKVRYSIFMASASGSRFEENASYRAVHNSSTSPEIRVIGRTDRDSTFSGCAVLTMCIDDNNNGNEISSTCGDYYNNDHDSDDNEDRMYFRLSVSKGIDPALMICFAAFIDETMEKTMRKQYQILSSTP